MRHPIDVFRDGIRAGVAPGGQLAASREGVRVAEVAEGRLGPGSADPSMAVDEDTIYDLASLTKPLATATLLGLLSERGQLELSDPIARFIDRVDPSVTIGAALTHSAGWPAHRRFDLELPPDITPGTWDAFDSIVRAAASVPLEVAPGQRSLYSDIGFILLGALVERAGGGPISEQFRAWNGPSGSLGYRDQRLGRPPVVGRARVIAPTEACAPGEAHDENARAMGGAAGHAGLFGTARDVLTLGERLVAAYNGARSGPLSPETVRRMFSPSEVVGSTRTYGWDRPSGAGSSTGGRWPSTSVGHLGFTGTSIWIEPERALIVVLVTNRVCPTRANEAIRKLRPEVHDAAWGSWG
ncbi:MAG: beta-lactamase family protein [Deltaproteobacteria bacterium]|nr:beta-lactamase family protein [Deltaproteobacteria bacterium]